MTTKDAIKHLSWKISFAKDCSTHWADCVNVDALEIAVRAMAEEQKKGKWVRDEFGSKCSCCGLYAYRNKFEETWESNFCPNCGADMREEETDERNTIIM